MILTLAATACWGQTPGARPTFEAASVKPNTSGSNSSSTHGSKGQLVAVNQSMHQLVERAYNVKAFQLTGPDWMDNVRFDVIAKYPENSTNEDRLVMMRTLLEDRFKLVAHTDTKEMPGYALVIVKGGLKIKPVEKVEGGTDSNSTNGAVKFRATSISMKEMASYLARRLNSTVIDSTGNDALFSFQLNWQVDASNTGSVDRGADEFAAIQDAIGTLGLHLQTQKVPVQVVVVDHIERVPVEN